MGAVQVNFEAASIKEIRVVCMLGSKEEIKWRHTGAGLLLSAVREKPCRYAFVYRIDLK